MSVYATIASSDDLNDPGWWAISVNVVHRGDPIRINHGDAEWYLPEETVDQIIEHINRVKENT